MICILERERKKNDMCKIRKKYVVKNNSRFIILLFIKKNSIFLAGHKDCLLYTATIKGLKKTKVNKSLKYGKIIAAYTYEQAENSL